MVDMNSIHGKDMAKECNFEASPSFINLMNAYYNSIIGWYRNETKFISVKDHINSGNGQPLTLRDGVLIVIMALIIGVLKSAFNTNVDQVSQTSIRVCEQLAKFIEQ